jgi:hypothetical protein
VVGDIGQAPSDILSGVDRDRARRHARTVLSSRAGAGVA